MELDNLVMVTDELPPIEEGVYPEDTKVLTGDIPPDDLKQLMDIFIEDGFDIILGQSLVDSCGIRESDFKEQTESGKTRLFKGTVEEVVEEYQKIQNKKKEDE
jgi:hypothetical protein